MTGFVAFLAFAASNMRGASWESVEYDGVAYFGVFLLSTIMGPIALAVFAAVNIITEQLFTKLIYKIVNIGVKNGKEEESASGV